MIRGARTALAMVAVDPPDLILLDRIMPGKDGFRAVEESRLVSGTGNIPIIWSARSIAATRQMNQALPLLRTF